MAQPVELYDFTQLLLSAARAVGDHPIDPALEVKLNRELPADGEEFQRILQACREAMAAGWMCQAQRVSGLAELSSRLDCWVGFQSMWWK